MAGGHWKGEMTDVAGTEARWDESGHRPTHDGNEKKRMGRWAGGECVALTLHGTKPPSFKIKVNGWSDEPDPVLLMYLEDRIEAKSVILRKAVTGN